MDSVPGGRSEYEGELRAAVKLVERLKKELMVVRMQRKALRSQETDLQQKWVLATQEVSRIVAWAGHMPQSPSLWPKPGAIDGASFRRPPPPSEPRRHLHSQSRLQGTPPPPAFRNFRQTLSPGSSIGSPTPSIAGSDWSLPSNRPDIRYERGPRGNIAEHMRLSDTEEGPEEEEEEQEEEVVVEEKEEQKEEGPSEDGDRTPTRIPPQNPRTLADEAQEQGTATAATANGNDRALPGEGGGPTSRKRRRR